MRPKADKGEPRPIPIKLTAIRCLGCRRWSFDLLRSCPYCGMPRGGATPTGGWY